MQSLVTKEGSSVEQNVAVDEKTALGLLFLWASRSTALFSLFRTDAII